MIYIKIIIFDTAEVDNCFLGKNKIVNYLKDIVANRKISFQTELPLLLESITNKVNKTLWSWCMYCSQGFDFVNVNIF